MAALAEDLSSDPSTHIRQLMTTYNISSSAPFSGLSEKEPAHVKTNIKTNFFFSKKTVCMAHACNPHAGEAETGRILGFTDQHI